MFRNSHPPPSQPSNHNTHQRRTASFIFGLYINHKAFKRKITMPKFLSFISLGFSHLSSSVYNCLISSTHRNHRLHHPSSTRRQPATSCSQNRYTVFHPEQASHKSSRLNEGNYDESFGTPSDGDSNDDPSMFFELMSPDSSTKPDQMSASALAYLGDVLFELFIRSRYVWPNRRMSDLQNKVVSIVRGEC